MNEDIKVTVLRTRAEKAEAELAEVKLKADGLCTAVEMNLKAELAEVKSERDRWKKAYKEMYDSWVSARDERDRLRFLVMLWIGLHEDANDFVNKGHDLLVESAREIGNSAKKS